MNLLTLSPTSAISTTTTPVIKLPAQPRNLTAQAAFVYGSGGTSFDFWLQVSLDQGTTWTDVANFHFTTASARNGVNLNAQSTVVTALLDGALAANTVQDGILAPMVRGKYSSAGTYTTTTITVDIHSDQLTR